MTTPHFHCNSSTTQTSLYSCPCTFGFSHKHPPTTVQPPCEQQPPSLGASFAQKPFHPTHPNTQPTPDIHAFHHSSSPIIPPEPPALVLLRNPDPTTYRPLLPQATISATLYCVHGVHSAPSWPPIPTAIPPHHVAVSGLSIWFGLTFHLPPCISITLSNYTSRLPQVSAETQTRKLSRKVVLMAIPTFKGVFSP